MNSIFRCYGYELGIRDIVRAQNCTLTDARGKTYTDFEAGVWCTALGHNHPRINRVIQQHLEGVCHTGYRYTNPVVEAAAADLLELAGFAGGQVSFLSSGSEAVEFGVQAIRRIRPAPLMLTLADSYLAAYGSAGSKAAPQWYSLDWSQCRACAQSETCSPRCEMLQGVPFDQIGGFAFEPGNSGGLVRLPPGGLVRQLAEQVQQRGGLVVVDEVTTGMGRTGTWFGYQHYDLQPDILALAKGLGNGYPVSAVLMRQGIPEALESTGFHYAQSHQDDPLGSAIAQEVLSVLREEGLIERSRCLGADFLGRLQQLAARFDCIREARGRGLMIVLEFQPDFDLAALHRRLIEQGFMMGYKPAAHLLRFYPALTIPEEEIARLVETLEKEICS